MLNMAAIPSSSSSSSSRRGQNVTVNIGDGPENLMGHRRSSRSGTAADRANHVASRGYPHYSAFTQSYMEPGVLEKYYTSRHIKHEGYLSLRVSASPEEWRQLWFILHEGVLYSFPSREQAESLKHETTRMEERAEDKIRLETVTAVVTASNYGDCTFLIDTKDKEYFFRAETKELMHNWKFAFHASVRVVADLMRLKENARDYVPFPRKHHVRSTRAAVSLGQLFRPSSPELEGNYRASVDSLAQYGRQFSLDGRGRAGSGGRADQSPGTYTGGRSNSIEVTNYEHLLTLSQLHFAQANNYDRCSPRLGFEGERESDRGSPGRSPQFGFDEEFLRDEQQSSEKEKEKRPVVHSSNRFDLDVDVSEGNDEFGVTSLKGNREKMEDVHSCIPNLRALGDFAFPTDGRCAFYAIYDGHCGRGAALFSEEKLPWYTLQHAAFKDNPQEAVSHSVQLIDKEYCQLAGEQDLYDGTTAVVALRLGNELLFANVGDSAAYISEHGRAVPMTSAQTPGRDDERRRIEGAGGWVTEEKELQMARLHSMDLSDPLIRETAEQVVRWVTIYRVNGELAVSRAIGDPDYKGDRHVQLEGLTPAMLAVGQGLTKYLWHFPQNHSGAFFTDLVIPDPEFQTHTIGPGTRFMVIACDGLWDVMSGQEVINFVTEQLDAKVLSVKEVSQELANLAVRRGSSDNVSVIIVRFDVSADSTYKPPSHQQL